MVAMLLLHALLRTPPPSGSAVFVEVNRSEILRMDGTVGGTVELVAVLSPERPATPPGESASTNRKPTRKEDYPRAKVTWHSLDQARGVFDTPDSGLLRLVGQGTFSVQAQLVSSDNQTTIKTVVITSKPVSALRVNRSVVSGALSVPPESDSYGASYEIPFVKPYIVGRKADLVLEAYRMGSRQTKHAPNPPDGSQSESVDKMAVAEEAHIELTVRVLDPTVATLQSGDKTSSTLTAQSGDTIQLVPLTEGETSLLISGGGRSTSKTIQVAMPRMRVAGPHVSPADQYSVEWTIEPYSTRFGALDEKVFVQDAPADLDINVPVQTGKNTIIIKSTKSGVYRVTLNTAGQTLDQSVTFPPVIGSASTVLGGPDPLIVGDTVLRPLNLYGQDGRPVDIPFDSGILYSLKDEGNRSLAIVSAIEDSADRHLRIVPQASGTGTLRASVGGQLIDLGTVEIREPLKVETYQVEEKEVRHKFGSSVARDFFVVRLNLTNNLGSAAIPDFAGKNITVYGRGIKIPALWAVDSEIITGDNNLYKIVGSGVNATEAQTLAALNDLKQKHNQRKTNADKEIPVIVDTSALYLSADMTSSQNARDQQKPLNIFERLFSRFVTIADFLNTAYPKAGSNPFRGNSDIQLRGQFNTLLVQPLKKSVQEQELQSRATGSASKILEETLDVPPSPQPTVVYLFVLKQKMLETHTGMRLRTVGIQLDSTKVSYSIARNKQTTVAQPGSGG